MLSPTPALRLAEALWHMEGVVPYLPNLSNRTYTIRSLVIQDAGPRLHSLLIMHVPVFLTILLSSLFHVTSAIFADQSILASLDELPVLHFTLSRRGGVFTAIVPGTDWVNLTYLTEELDRTECRFNLTRREAKGNKLIRKAKADETGGKESSTLMGELATNGTW